MKEYKIVTAKLDWNFAEAERVMNEQAENGWEVVSVCYETDVKNCAIITLTRERKFR